MPAKRPSSTHQHAKLTQAFVRKLAPLPHGDLFVWDSDVSGFGVRVKPSGTTSYLVRYRTRHGIQRQTTIAQASVIAAEDARKQARALLADAARGSDPAAEKQAARKAWTIAELADYWRKHHAPKLRPTTRQRQEYLLTHHLLPKLKSKAVAELTAVDVRGWLRPLTDRGHVMANNCRALLSKMMALAIEHGIRTDNPVAAVRKNAETPRTRYLSNDELGRFVLACESLPVPRMGAYFLLLLLTGARKGETLRARWEDFDLDAAVWTKPSAHTKQKRDHHVPLSPDAVTLLRNLRKLAPVGVPWLFPGADPREAMVEPKRHWRLLRKAAKLTADVSIHTLRHTHASLLVSAGTSLPRIGRALGHTQSRTTERYAHLDLSGMVGVPDLVAAAAAAAKAQAEAEAAQAAEQDGSKVVSIARTRR